MRAQDNGDRTGKPRILRHVLSPIAMFSDSCGKTSYSSRWSGKVKTTHTDAIKIGTEASAVTRSVVRSTFIASLRCGFQEIITPVLRCALVGLNYGSGHLGEIASA